jgi:hypothetical protein
MDHCCRTGDVCHDFRSDPTTGRKKFKQEERAQDARKAMSEYEAEARAIREKTARLKALRLAKEAKAQTDAPPAKSAERRLARREK